MAIRVLIADDHGVIRAGLRSMLKAELDIKVVGEAVDGNDVLRLAAKLSPDIVLMDLSMPGLNGIDATRKLHEILPGIKVLILTSHEDESMLQEAIKAGASGYIIKRASEEDLMIAIQAVWRGDIYIHSAMTRSLIKNIPAVQSDQPPVVESLTPREIDVLRLLCYGYTNRQMAKELKLSERTVEGYRANLIGKLGLRSRMDLVNYAEECGLFDGGNQKSDLDC